MATSPHNMVDNDPNAGSNNDKEQPTVGLDGSTNGAPAGAAGLLGAGSVGEGDVVDNNSHVNHNVGDVASAIKEATNVAERVAAVAADISQTLASNHEGGEVEEVATMPPPNNNAVPNPPADGDNNDQKPAAAHTDPIDDGMPKAEEEEDAESKKTAAASLYPFAGAGAADTTIDANVVDDEEESVPKVRKKRTRRVGMTVPRKLPKVEIEIAPRPSADGTPVDLGVDEDGIPRIYSKHDEKWNNMFDKLVDYKNQNDNCMVPQCYHDDPRLGRWVHYQRVEYWIYQQTGNGKITPERIARLDALDFEWDPQAGKWTIMYKKLLEFKDQIGHCKVPKGYSKDTELANWVRNQRLEHANMIKGKRSRMTDERFQKLDSLGFKWSTTMPPKMKPSPMKKKSPSAAEELAAEAAAVVAAVAARDNNDGNEMNGDLNEAAGAAEPEANGGGNAAVAVAAAGALANQGDIAEV